MRRTSILALLVISLTAALALASCGGEKPGGSEGGEGEPIELGGLSYNVGLTRFLNPDDPEDSEYLVGQRQAPAGKYYLGVFLVIANDGSDPVASADSYTVIDTLDNEYRPVTSESPYALAVGAEVPADDQLPAIDTTAQTGPNQGALLIFEVDDSVSDNRPLQLEIDGPGGQGEVTLDI